MARRRHARGKGKLVSAIAIVHGRELDTWAPAFSENITSEWPVVPVGEVLKPSNVQFYNPLPGEVIRLGGMRWYGDGLFIRETRMGSDLTGRCFPLVPGNLVYNRLFA